MSRSISCAVVVAFLVPAVCCAWDIDNPVSNSLFSKSSNVLGSGPASGGSASFKFWYEHPTSGLPVTEDQKFVTVTGEEGFQTWNTTLTPPSGGWHVSPMSNSEDHHTELTGGSPVWSKGTGNHTVVN